MDLRDLKKQLLEATTRLSSWPFDQLTSMAGNPWTEEVGRPTDLATGTYCQIEAELLDRFLEDGVDTLHMTVNASDCFQELGTVFFVRQNGEVYWDRKVYQFVNGVPQLIE